MTVTTELGCAPDEPEPMCSVHPEMARARLAAIAAVIGWGFMMAPGWNVADTGKSHPARPCQHKMWEQFPAGHAQPSGLGSSRSCGLGHY